MSRAYPSSVVELAFILLVVTLHAHQLDPKLGIIDAKRSSIKHHANAASAVELV